MEDVKKERTTFYNNKAGVVNAIMLYNLKSNTTSFFKDIYVYSGSNGPGNLQTLFSFNY